MNDFYEQNHSQARSTPKDELSLYIRKKNLFLNGRIITLAATLFFLKKVLGLIPCLRLLSKSAT